MYGGPPSRQFWPVTGVLMVQPQVYLRLAPIDSHEIQDRRRARRRLRKIPPIAVPAEVPPRAGIVEIIIAFGIGAHVRPQLATKDATLHEEPRRIRFQRPPIRRSVKQR